MTNLLLLFAESQRPSSRARGLTAAGGWSWLCSWAPAASWERKACRRPEETRGTAALHHLPRRKSSGLPTGPEAQTRLLLWQLMEWSRPGLRTPWRTNPMFKWGGHSLRFSFQKGSCGKVKSGTFTGDSHHVTDQRRGPFYPHGAVE